MSHMTVGLFGDHGCSRLGLGSRLVVSKTCWDHCIAIYSSDRVPDREKVPFNEAEISKQKDNLMASFTLPLHFHIGLIRMASKGAGAQTILVGHLGWGK